MKRYVIERALPGIGGMSKDELAGAAAVSNRALAEVGPSIRWLHSYVTADKTFCVYEAESVAAIRRHAEISGFPADTVSEVLAMLEPSSAAMA